MARISAASTRPHCWGPLIAYESLKSPSERHFGAANLRYHRAGHPRKLIERSNWACRIQAYADLGFEESYIYCSSTADNAMKFCNPRSYNPTTLLHNSMHPHMYYARGPSRLLWFILGGTTVAWFTVWRHDRQPGMFRACYRRARDAVMAPEDAYPPPPPAHQQYGGSVQERADETYLWKLRSEKEAQRRRDELRVDVERAKDKV